MGKISQKNKKIIKIENDTYGYSIHPHEKQMWKIILLVSWI